MESANELFAIGFVTILFIWIGTVAYACKGHWRK
jgi:hypothetical protein